MLIGRTPCIVYRYNRDIQMPNDTHRNQLRRQPRIWAFNWSYLRFEVLPSRPVQLLVQTGLKWDRDNCPGMAAALSYYALFSLFPLLLVILSIVGALIGPETDAFLYVQKMIVRDLPPAIHDMVVGTILALHQNSVGAGIVGFSLLFFAASKLFIALRHSVNVIWESPARISEAGSVRKMVLLFFLNKLLAYLLVLATALLLIVSLVANLLIRAVIGVVNHFQQHLDFIQQVDELLLTRGLQVSASVFILSVTLCIIFKLLPTVRPQWRDVWLGAVITALLLVGLQQFATGGVVSVFSKFLSYGVIGSVMILMLWIFLAFQIVLTGCELSSVYARLYGSRRSAGA